jgi:hypothetical protein
VIPGKVKELDIFLYLDKFSKGRIPQEEKWSANIVDTQIGFQDQPYVPG